MKMVYTNENRFLVANAKNILEAEEIPVFLKNQYASGGLGELSAFATWVELWVSNDADYQRACTIIASALSDDDTQEWHCPNCGESNDAAFEFCWQCQTEYQP
ncbi:DUF2007 domain-containing protein [Halioxenophilus sp. WMMB6]|uniref:putative signal transducing protein n=1 Tax=Halioxenophilus sp. WMMB6 TaxID=3073815 RepID=UPI00295F4211|nr:DUF2007 domain-containing protein [Halioxenophilus sp. WMMB6]